MPRTRSAPSPPSVYSLPRLQPNSGLPEFGHVLTGRSRINPTSAGGLGRGHAPRFARFTPSPVNGGREQTECAARACAAHNAANPRPPLRVVTKRRPTGAAAHGASERAACGGAGGGRGLGCAGAPPPPRRLGGGGKSRRGPRPTRSPLPPAPPPPRPRDKAQREV